MFDIAKLGPALYFECVGERVGQKDTAAANAGLERLARTVDEKSLVPVNDAECVLLRLLVCRLFVLLRLTETVLAKVDKFRLWEGLLLAQLDGACEQSDALYALFAGLSGDTLRMLWSHLCNQARSAWGARPMLLFDEAHQWAKPSFGRYAPTNGNLIDGTRPFLHRAMYFVRTEGRCPSLWAGTALSLGDFAKLQSGTGLVSSLTIDDKFKHFLGMLVIDFPPLSSAMVAEFLQYHLPPSSFEDASVLQRVADGLRGRARLAAAVTILAARANCSSPEVLWETYEKYRLEMIYGPPRRSADEHRTRMLAEYSATFREKWESILSVQGSSASQL